MTWVLVIAGLSFLIIIHEAGHFFAAKATGMRVEKFFLFFPPKLVSIKRGETEYGIGAIPAGGYVKITGMNPDEELPPEVAARGYYRQPVWKRIVVIGAGPAMNIGLAFLILFGLAFGMRDLTTRVGAIVPHSPAAAALQQGDEIVAVDGHRLPSLSLQDRLTRFSNLVASHKCAGAPSKGCRATTPVRLEIRRRGQLRTISVTPVYAPGLKHTRIGFRYAETPADLTVPQAAGEAASDMWLVTYKTVGAFARIFEPKERQQLHGIVGISRVSEQAISFGPREALGLLALISLSLGLINLFPFLPLDGGHIFWSLVEKFRGRPVPFSVMERAGAIGFVLVLMLFFVGLTNDLGWSGGGVHVK